MKKVYERPEVRTIAVTLGVFGDYGSDDGGCGEDRDRDRHRNGHLRKGGFANL